MVQGVQSYLALQELTIDMSYTHILLASHGTPGAYAAEVFAFNLCSPDTALHHLIVVPDFWKGMLGDDWLNNAVTQIRYGKYLESELEQEIQENVNRVSAEAKARKIAYNYEFMLGKPAECLLKVANSSHFDLVVMGSPRPKNKEGLKSRMHCETLLRGLSIPLLIIPYPHDV
jgi:nucleotide-binding universal stress UspA family protein